MPDTVEAKRLMDRVAEAKSGGGNSPKASRPPDYTDIGNGQRFVRDHGNDVRYCAEWRNNPGKGFLAWQPTGSPVEGEGGPQRLVQTGGRWAVDEVGEVHRKGKATIAGIPTEHERYSAPVNPETEFDHFVKSQADSKLTDMLNMAKSELPIPCTSREFDLNPFLLNVRNGTIDLSPEHCGEWRPARREDMMRNQTPGEFRPIPEECKECDGCEKCELARSPLWMMTLQRICALEPQKWHAEGRDKELEAYMARVAGYCLTGLSREKAFFLFYGPPNTGKGTFVETLLALLGEDYAIVTATEAISATKGFAQHPADIAAMKGKRLIIATETGEKLNIEKIKQITGGGDTMAGRGMRENWSQQKATWKLVMQTNKFPQTGDPGFYSRLHLVPFDSAVPLGEQVATLKEDLRKELPGILNWALAGLKDYYEQGINPPARILEAGATMRAEVDDVGRFLTACTRTGAGLRVTKDALYRKYTWWCEAVELMHSGSRSIFTKKTFGRCVKESGISEKKIMSERFWTGIDVLEPAPPAGNPPSDDEIMRRSNNEAAEGNPLFEV